MYLLNWINRTEIFLNQSKFSFCLGQLLLQSQQLLRIIVDNISWQLINSIYFMELVVQKQLSQYLILFLSCKDFFSEF